MQIKNKYILEDLSKYLEQGATVSFDSDGDNSNYLFLNKAAEAREKQVGVEVLRIKAEAFLNFSRVWNGQVPKFVTIGGSQNPFLFNMDSE